MVANKYKFSGRKAMEELRKWEAYGLGFNADYDIDGYVCIGSDVSLYDTEDVAEFVMNTPPPPSRPYYFEMSLNDRLAIQGDHTSFHLNIEPPLSNFPNT